MPSLVTFVEPFSCEFRKSAGGMKITFEAGRPYLIGNTQLDRLLLDDNVKNRVYKISRADNRVRNFNATIVPQKPERVLIFNGSGGYGDQIMTWPFARILSQRFEVHVLTDPGNSVCWWNMPFVKSIHTIPIQWATVQMFDHCVFFEHVVNMDEHQDQMHPLDMMLHKVGINPMSIPSEAKVVAPLFTHSEQQGTKAWLEKGKLGIYQLSGANSLRCLPVADSVYLLIRLVEAYPDIHWLAVYDEFVPKEYKELAEVKLAEAKLTNAQVVCFGNLRDLWALTQCVAVVVGPDSMMVHLAGSLGVPCVGLWGPISPENRVKYYPRHTAIYHREYCPHAPCYAYTGKFPRYCPPKPVERTVCECIGGISATEVVEAVATALQS